MEELFLLAIWRLQEDAYGLTIRQQVAGLLEREVSLGTVYLSLERLERSGLVAARESDPVARRGGRRKRLYRLTPRGLSALAAIWRLHEAAWAGLTLPALER